MRYNENKVIDKLVLTFWNKCVFFLVRAIQTYAPFEVMVAMVGGAIGCSDPFVFRLNTHPFEKKSIRRRYVRLARDTCELYTVSPLEPDAFFGRSWFRDFCTSVHQRRPDYPCSSRDRLAYLLSRLRSNRRIPCVQCERATLPILNHMPQTFSLLPVFGLLASQK